jgi:crotonobetaine/carnitine-CoA ligase
MKTQTKARGRGRHPEVAMATPRSPYDGMDMRTLLRIQAIRHPARRFLVWEPFEGVGRSWTYPEFLAAVEAFAAGLRERGAGPGDRILIHLDNCPEFLMAWLGCAWAGAVGVTSNTRLTQGELDYVAAHSRVVGAVTQPRFAETVEAATGEACWVAVTQTDAGAPPTTSWSSPRTVAFDAIAGDLADLPLRPHDPTAPFAVQYTSGTTARPKAVLWTHANALWGAEMSAAHENLRPDDIHLVQLPLFHTNAQVYSVLATLWAGAALVLTPRFSASRFWPISLKHRCTWASLVNFCTRALLEHPIPAEHHYRHWGLPVCEPAGDATFGVRSIGWWGMTETVTHGIVGSSRLPNTPGSIGRAAPGYDVFVLDADGQPVAPGGVGDLFIRGVRGVSLFQEYVDDPDATAAAFRGDGLFITGDRVRVGADGELYFADRSKDVLKVGGENVSASEVERVILTVPGVREAAVVGRPDAMLGETVVAFVIPKGAADPALRERVMDACRAALASFKRPTDVWFVDEFPRSTLEKVAKAELRRRLVSDEPQTPA